MAEPAKAELRIISGQSLPQPEPPPRPVPPQAAGHIQTLRLRRGQRIAVEGERTEYDFYGGSFYLASRELSRRLPHLRLTVTQYDVWHTLLGEQHRGGVVTMTQAQIAKNLGTSRRKVGEALALFSEWGLIWRPRRGKYRINPRIAFFGKSAEQEEALGEMPADVPPITLPDWQVRPPRRRASQEDEG